MKYWMRWLSGTGTPSPEDDPNYEWYWENLEENPECRMLGGINAESLEEARAKVLKSWPKARDITLNERMMTHEDTGAPKVGETVQYVDGKGGVTAAIVLMADGCIATLRVFGVKFVDDEGLVDVAPWRKWMPEKPGWRRSR